MAVNATFSGQINTSDGNSGTTQKNISVVAAGVQVQSASGLLIDTSPTSIAIPNAQANFVYIKNLHASNTLTVTWTPNGGSSNVVVTLEPGGAIILGQSTTGGGITALSVQASGASTPIEYSLVG
jgi:hypothetical protein